MANERTGGLDAVGAPSTVDNAVQGAAQEMTGGGLGGANINIAGKGMGVGAGKSQLSPTQTNELLANMQEMIAQKTGGWNQFMSGLKDAAAWAVPGLDGQKQLALASRDEAKRQEAQDVFSMQQQMAAAKSQADMAAANKMRARGMLSGGADGTPSSAIAQLPVFEQQRIMNAPEEMQYDLIQDALKRQGSEAMKSDYLKQNPFDVPGRGTFMMNAPQIKQWELTGKIPDDAVQVGKPSGASPSSISPVAGGLSPRDIGQVESGNRINIGASPKGALGPMQTMPGTLTSPGYGVAPAQNRSPEEMKRVGDDYFNAMKNKYDNDTLAAIAYNMGPAATDKWISSGADFNKLPQETRDYIGKAHIANAMSTRQAARQPQDASATTPPTRKAGEPVQAFEARMNEWKETNKAQREVETATSKEYGTGLAKTQAASATAVDENFATAGDRINRQQNSLNLLDDPSVKKMVGYLEVPGVGAATLRLLRDGITMGRLGELNIKDFDATLAKSGASQSEIDQFNKLITNLKSDQLTEAQAKLKGQGAVSDMERKLVADTVGSISSSVDALKTAVKWRQERAQLDKEMGDAFNAYRKQNGEYAPFGAFMRTEGQRVIDAHNARLANILGVSKDKVAGNRGYEQGKPSGKQVEGSDDINSLIDRYKTKK